MMRLVLLWVAVLLLAGTCVFGAEDTASTLARAMKESLQGGITSHETRTDLHRIYSSPASLEHKVTAGYLLTLVENDEEPYAHYPYVEYLLSVSEIEAMLGAEAHDRLLQLSADYHYEHAKFDKAAETYHRLLATKSPELKQYAALKLGWTYLNKERAKDAFDLWLGFIKDSKKEKRAISPNILRGLGQAMTENTGRDSSEIIALNELKLDPAQQELVAEGMLDGRYYLTQAAAFTTWASQMSQLAFHEKLQTAVAAMPAADAADACRKLHLLSVKENEKLPYEKYGPMLATCFEVSQKKGKKAVEGVELLDRLVAKLDARLDQRFLPFSFYTLRGNPVAACEEGIHWIAETEAEGQSNVPVRDVLKSCTKALESSELAKGKIIASLDARQKTKPLFGSVNSPMLFLVTGLLSHEGFANDFGAQVMANRGSYSSKWLAAVLAESLASQGKQDKALALADSLKKEDRTGKVGELRDQILLSKAGKTIDHGSLDQAQAELTANWSDDEILSSPDRRKAFVLLTAKAFEKSPRPVWVRDNVKKLLSRPERLSGDLKLAAGVLEMGAELGLWNETWQALAALSQGATRPSLSGKLEVGIFEAMAGGKLASVKADSLPKGDLKLLAESAQHVSGKNAEIESLAVGKKSALQPDVTYLKGLERRGSKATAKKKTALDDITGWVSFIDHLSKSYRKFQWASPTLYRKSLDLVEGYCSGMRQELAKKTAAEAGIPADQWKELEATLSANLGECLNWVGASRKSEGGQG